MDTPPKKNAVPDNSRYVGRATDKSFGQVLVPSPPFHRFASDSWPSITDLRVRHLLDDHRHYRPSGTFRKPLTLLCPKGRSPVSTIFLVIPLTTTAARQVRFI